MTDFKYLTFEPDASGVVVVSMNRPPANAVNQDMYRELAAFFSDPDQLSAEVRAIVLTGTGKHFCAGNDLEEFVTMSPENGTERMRRVREAFLAIQECPVPIVGAVQGAALGTGLAIAAACDFVVASEDARFGLPELTVGVMGGASHLARIAPQPLVRRLFFTGEHLAPNELVALGGSVAVCAAPELLKEARRLAGKAASFSPTAVRIAKQILNRIESMDLKTGYEFEQGFTVKMSGHPDSKEALRAFAEKRPAQWQPRDPSWKIQV